MDKVIKMMNKFQFFIWTKKANKFILFILTDIAYVHVYLRLETFYISYIRGLKLKVSCGPH